MSTIIQAYCDNKDRSVCYVIPMKDESNCHMFGHINSATWVYYNDGKPHKNHRINRNIPAIVGYPIIDIWGGEDDVRAAGYRKHWIVFKDLDTGLYYFGNYPSFNKSKDPRDVAQALEMVCIDINILQEL